MKLALLLPADDPDFVRACELADSLAAQQPAVWWAPPIKALADYRRGQFEQALEWADKAIGSGDGFAPRNTTAWYIRAVACARLQRMDLARAAMAKAQELMRNVDENSSSYMNDWEEWRIADIMRRQAAELLGITESKASIIPVPPRQIP